MPKQEEVKFAGVCVVDGEALNAILEQLSLSKAGNVLAENLSSKSIRNLTVDEVENLNAYLAEKRKKSEEKSKEVEKEEA